MASHAVPSEWRKVGSLIVSLLTKAADVASHGERKVAKA